jgi:hypothetical protein
LLLLLLLLPSLLRPSNQATKPPLPQTELICCWSLCAVVSLFTVLCIAPCLQH